MCEDSLIEDVDAYWRSVEEAQEEQEGDEYTLLDYLEFLSYDCMRDREAEKAGVFSGLDRFFVKK